MGLGPVKDKTTRAEQQHAKDGEPAEDDTAEVGTPQPPKQGRKPKAKAKSKAKAAKAKAKAKAAKAKAKAKAEKAKAKAKAEKAKAKAKGKGGEATAKAQDAKDAGEPNDSEEDHESELDCNQVLKKPAAKKMKPTGQKRATSDLKATAQRKKPRTSAAGKDKATFARRWRPACEPSGQIWEALKHAFETTIEARVISPSRQEDMNSSEFFLLSVLHGSNRSVSICPPGTLWGMY